MEKLNQLMKKTSTQKQVKNTPEKKDLQHSRVYREKSNEKCPDCGSPIDIGHVYGLTLRILMCHCREEKEKKEIINKYIHNAGFPPDLFDIIIGKSHIKFDGLSVLPATSQYMKKMDDLIKNNIGLFLIGNVGIGKTLSIINLLMEIIRKYSFNTKYITMFHLNELYKSYDIQKKMQYNKLKYAKILFIDDVGINFSDMLFDLIDFRKSNYKITFMATNYDITELQDKLHPALMSRIKSNMILDCIQGEDKRKLIIEGMADKKAGG